MNCGELPEVLKHAPIRPLLKKHNLDSELLQNYRPVSIFLPIIKLIEKPVCNQLQKYLFDNNLHAKCQSAYRDGHSTETAILCVYNDVMCSLDKRPDAVLIMLDLSAAFNTIDNDILLHRLHTRFGINGTVLNWFSSCLNCRTERVVVGTAMSDTGHVYCDIPQGSVLEPVLY